MLETIEASDVLLHYDRVSTLLGPIHDMPQMYVIPNENIEEDILLLLQTPLLNLDPKEFKAHIKQEDIGDFEKRDRKVLFAISILEQEMEVLFFAAKFNNYWARQHEAQLIRERRQREHERLREVEATEKIRQEFATKLSALEGRTKLDFMKIFRKALEHGLTGTIGAGIVYLLGKGKPH